MLTAEKKAARAPRVGVQWSRPSDEVSITRELSKAIAKRDLKEVALLCQLRPPADSVLGEAFESDEVLAILLANGLNPNRTFMHTRLSLLAAAVQQGQVNAVYHLLKAGANPNYQFGDASSTPLHVCTHPDIALALISAGADINHPKRGVTPLMAACTEGRDPMLVRLLLDYGAPVDASCGHVSPTAWDVPYVTHAKTRAIHFACEAGNTDAVQLLIEAGAAVDAIPTDTCPPLLHALTTPNRSTPIVAYLLAQGANPNARSISGSTALQVLSLKFRSTDKPVFQRLVGTLLAAGAELPRVTDIRMWDFLRNVCGVEQYTAVASVVQILRVHSLIACTKM